MNAIEIADASLLAPDTPRARRPKRKPKPPREPKRVYEVRYFKDERGRSVQLRRCVTLGLESDWEPIPSSKSSYTTFDNSRLTYARSAGLPSLGRKYSPGRS